MSSVGEKLQSASASLFKAAKGGDEAAARAALDAATAAGVDPDQSWTATSITDWKDGPNQSTPLHYAAANGHASVVKLLVERGADLNATNMNRSTALHVAARFGHESVMKLLVELGADVNAEDLYGKTPLLNPSAGRDPGFQLTYM